MFGSAGHCYAIMQRATCDWNRIFETCLDSYWLCLSMCYRCGHHRLHRWYQWRCRRKEEPQCTIELIMHSVQTAHGQSDRSEPESIRIIRIRKVPNSVQMIRIRIEFGIIRISDIGYRFEPASGPVIRMKVIRIRIESGCAWSGSEFLTQIYLIP